MNNRGQTKIEGEKNVVYEVMHGENVAARLNTNEMLNRSIKGYFFIYLRKAVGELER